MTQKVIQIGNSMGIIIPKALLDKLQIKPGNEVIIEESAESLRISKKGSRSSSITPDFMELINKVNKQYGKALKTLAEK